MAIRDKCWSRFFLSLLWAPLDTMVVSLSCNNTWLVGQGKLELALRCTQQLDSLCMHIGKTTTSTINTTSWSTSSSNTTATSIAYNTISSKDIEIIDVSPGSSSTIGPSINISLNSSGDEL